MSKHINGMKNLLLKSVMTVLMALFSLNTYPYDVCIDGIYYNLVKKAKTAEVTSGDQDYSGKVIIPSFFLYDGVTYNVTSIGHHAFSNLNSLIDIQFGMKEGLTSIFIPSSIKTINGGAFIYLPALREVHIEDMAWWYNFDFAVEDHSSILSISPRIAGDPTDNPLEFAGHLFLHDEEITDLIVPADVTEIKSRTFHGCVGLKSITIHNNVTSIGESTFQDCIGLTSLTIPNSVTSIGIAAFSGCSGLASVVIPNSVVSIGERAFAGCSGMTSATLSDNVTSLTSTFNGCSSLKSVTIPEGVTSIGGYTFYGCSELTSVNIPNSVTRIGHYAFANDVGLTSLILPYNIDIIGGYAFIGCKNITDVFCYTEVLPKMEGLVFADAYVEYATLHVPSSSIELYKSDSQWGTFGKIVALNPAKYTLTYMINDEIYTTVEVESGTTITPETPVKEGYIFAGWNSVPTIMPFHDVIVKGSFLACLTTGKTYSFQNKISNKYLAIGIGGVGTSSDLFGLKLEDACDGQIYITDGELYIGEAQKNIWGDMYLTTVTELSTAQPISISYITYNGKEYYILKGALGMIGDTFFGGLKTDVKDISDNVLWLVKESDYSDDITDVATDDESYQIFTLDGKSVEILHKGVNIIRFSNGTTKSVYVK